MKNNKLTNSSKNKSQVLHWSNYMFDLDTITLISNALIKKSIQTFWNKHAIHINDNQHLLLLFRIQDESGIWSTLGRLQKVNKNALQEFIDFVIGILEIKSDEYNEIVVKRIAISFGIRDGKITTRKEIVPVKSFQNYKHYKLPQTMDPLKYGANPIIATDSIYVVPITPLTTAKIIVQNNENHVDIIKKGNVILSYVDRLINPTRFERSIGSNKYVFIQNEQLEFDLVLTTTNKSAKSISNLKPLKSLKNNKIATMDFETYTNKDGKMIPYLVSWYDGMITNSYFLTDFNSPENMIQKAVKDLLKAKYKGFKIYLHNFANFDSVFLLNTLTQLGFCKTIVNKGRLISVTLNFVLNNEMDNKKINVYSLDFRDSLQLLLMSLSKLAKAFGVGVQKGVFPHRFVNSDNLNYIGEVPAFKYFDNITIFEYLDYCINFNNDNWSLRDEAIKYCKQDCISLHQILIKFSELIFDKFKVNINKYPTLPSLSFAIFRTQFLNSFFPQLSGKISKDIRTSYTGGSTDMYIPTNLTNELVYAYDVNSLYPSEMANYPMPVGKPTYFEGDFRKINPEAFGFHTPIQILFIYLCLSFPLPLFFKSLKTSSFSTASLRSLTTLFLIDFSTLFLFTSSSDFALL
jgi:DNA polymerase type B, organellar and viral